MKLNIGFFCEQSDSNIPADTYVEQAKTIVPKKSVAQVLFPDRGAALAYYNDKFDLQIGDHVYVDGKLEGKQGRVIDINYNFKIRLSDYKKVIGLVDTSITGKLYTANSHFISFDRNVLPVNKIITWFKAPANDDDEFISGNDDAVFNLEDIKGMDVTPAIAERGHEYYLENRVKYICIDNSKGYAIVQGHDPYEVEFEYTGGEIRDLVCSCFCSYNCKHEFAAMLQLRETLELIEKNYSAEFNSSGYFAAVSKEILFNFAIAGKKTGSITL